MPALFLANWIAFHVHSNVRAFVIRYCVKFDLIAYWKRGRETLCHFGVHVRLYVSHRHIAHSTTIFMVGYVWLRTLLCSSLFYTHLTCTLVYNRDNVFSKLVQKNELHHNGSSFCRCCCVHTLSSAIIHRITEQLIFSWIQYDDWHNVLYIAKEYFADRQV